MLVRLEPKALLSKATLDMQARIIEDAAAPQVPMCMPVSLIISICFSLTLALSLWRLSSFSISISHSFL